MDLYCQLCGEPWDLFYVQDDMDIDGQKGDAKKFKKGNGCPACAWGKKAPKEKPLIAEAASAIYDVLGDDIDGIAAELEDINYYL